MGDMFKKIISRRHPKIFCISFQRTGTKSVGQFFIQRGFKVASYDAERSFNWSALRFIGDYESIFNSKEFIENQVFEDNPWWEGDFYKVLYHRFPNAKFILFTRDADKWFDSMISHSKERTLGNTFMHSSIYRREWEYFNKFPDEMNYKNIREINNLLDLKEKHREHYKNIYNLRNKEVVDFFNHVSKDSLFIGQLEDKKKWVKLGAFFNLKVYDTYEVHANKTQNIK